MELLEDQLLLAVIVLLAAAVVQSQMELAMVELQLQHQEPVEVVALDIFHLLKEEVEVEPAQLPQEQVPAPILAMEQIDLVELVVQHTHLMV
jgi:hypothetical protein